MASAADEQLVTRFVASLQADQFFTPAAPPPAELNAGIDPDDWNCLRWAPAQIATSDAELKRFECELGVRLPPLYRLLVSRWRWLEMWTERIRIFANPPGERLDSLLRKIRADPVFDSHLVWQGVIPFGFDIDVYDPICFVTTARRPDGDCPIRRYEHEAMLSFDQIGQSWALWPSCRDMMLDVIGDG